MKKRGMLIFLILVMSVLVPNFVRASNESTKITEIQIISPKTGTYSEGKQIVIRAFFSGKISGNAPTLYVKFGTGNVITVSNGIIRNSAGVSTNGQYIEYSYIIQEKDEGKLSIIGLSGGSLKDADEKNVSISEPKISNSIKITAKTNNNVQDEEEIDEEDIDEETDEEEQTKSKEKEETKKSNKVTSRASRETRKKVNKLPDTGITGKYVILIGIIVMSLGIFFINKYLKLKDVK